MSFSLGVFVFVLPRNKLTLSPIFLADSPAFDANVLAVVAEVKLPKAVVVLAASSFPYCIDMYSSEAEEFQLSALT